MMFAIEREKSWYMEKGKKIAGIRNLKMFTKQGVYTCLRRCRNMEHVGRAVQGGEWHRDQSMLSTRCRNSIKGSIPRALHLASNM